MVVVTAIKEVVKIILRVAPIVYKMGQKAPPVVKYFDRHRKLGTIVTTAAATAPLIYDLLNIDYDAISFPKFPKTNKIGQTRNYLVQSQSKRFGRKEYTTCYPRRKRRQRY